VYKLKIVIADRFLPGGADSAKDYPGRDRFAAFLDFAVVKFELYLMKLQYMVYCNMLLLARTWIVNYAAKNRDCMLGWPPPY
jgi:hypothetical protein